MAGIIVYDYELTMIPRVNYYLRVSDDESEDGGHVHRFFDCRDGYGGPQADTGCCTCGAHVTGSVEY